MRSLRIPIPVLLALACLVTAARPVVALAVEFSRMGKILRPEAARFLKTWAARYHGQVPDALAALAYDTTNLLLRAIEEAGADDTGRVKAALEQTRFNGVTGRLTFDASHNPVKSVFILAVRGGRIELETIVDP